MKITFFGGPYRNAEVCYAGFDAIVELIAAGYTILDVEAA